MVKEKALMKLLDQMKQSNIQDKAMLSYCLRRNKNTENINWHVSKTSNYVIAEICVRELVSIWFRKYITAFHCFDKNLSVLSETSGAISIA